MDDKGHRHMFADMQPCHLVDSSNREGLRCGFIVTACRDV